MNSKSFLTGWNGYLQINWAYFLCSKRYGQFVKASAWEKVAKVRVKCTLNMKFEDISHKMLVHTQDGSERARTSAQAHKRTHALHSFTCRSVSDTQIARDTTEMSVLINLMQKIENIKMAFSISSILFRRCVCTKPKWNNKNNVENG